MKLSGLLAAKADQDKWLPLSQHLEDTKNVMEKLLESYIAPSVCVAAGLSYESFHKLALFVAYTHDIGKATSAFQIKMSNALPGYKSLIEKQGFTAKICGLESKSPHNIAGASILNQYFGINESICDIIASHHGKPIDGGRETKYEFQIKRLTDNYYKAESENAYRSTWNEIVNQANSFASVSDISDISTQAKMIITGLLIMADWIASCEDYFPLFDAYSSNVDPDRLINGMNALMLQPYQDFNLSSMDSEMFRERFGFFPNEMQKKVIDISNNMITPGIMIIEAPMGLGKTEAALAAAEVESCAAGTGGIFFGLPTRGTADAMFDRVRDWANTIACRNSASISLAHSKSGFNDSYNALHTTIYDENKAGVSVNSWMVGRYKKLLPDFTIGTVDQALFTVLKRRFLMLLHLGISGKTVIIDEVHSYDDYMNEYMKSMLSWLGMYKVPVILLSATLTKDRRNELVSAYCGMETDLYTDSYPAITWSDSGQVWSSGVETNNIRKMDITIKNADEGSVSELIKELLIDGGCAGIICDTVSRAQNTFEHLQSHMSSEYTIVLLHSRFLPSDRARHEKQILDLVGKDSVDRDKVVVVGTQVLEQSLDIDFDVLFTEKCPVDFLFQRLGRLHRHKRDARPEKIKNPVCYIFTDTDSCKSAQIYYDYIIRRTDEVLSKCRVMHIPGDIRRFTEAVYDLHNGSDRSDKQEYINRKEELKRQAKAYLLPQADKCRFKGMLTVENTGHNNESVRFGINTIETILLKKKGQDFETFSGVIIQGEAIPNAEQTKELLKNRISLRYDDELLSNEMDCKNDNGSTKLWKRNCYLEDEHFLIADENGLFKIGKSIYSYTKEYGWRREI